MDSDSPLSTSCTLVESIDHEADGVVDSQNSIVYTYNSLGQLVAVEEDEEYSPDKKSEEVDYYYFDYNADSSLATVTIESPYEGWSIGIEYFYDGSSHLERVEMDGGEGSLIDGTVEGWVTYSYSVDGFLTGLGLYTNDGAVMGHTFTNDGDGRVLTHDYDDHLDGTIDSRDSMEYTDEGLLSVSEIDDGRCDGEYFANGVADYRTLYTYDADGLMDSFSSDECADGIDEQVLLAYDARGNLTTRGTDEDLDGSPEYIVHYAYDENDNLTLVETDDDADGTVDSRRENEVTGTCVAIVGDLPDIIGFDSWY